MMCRAGSEIGRVSRPSTRNEERFHFRGRVPRIIIGPV